MSDSWFGGRKERPRGEVDWGRWVRRDHERAQQVLFGLIGLNVLVFILWSQARGSVLEGLMVQHFMVSVEALVHFRVWTLLTSAFSHYDTSHLLFNMIGLYVFGRDVGRALGSATLLQLYLVGGIAASVGHVLFSVFTGDMVPALGASGSVMALAVMFGALFPSRTLLINFFIPVPAALAVAGYLLLDVLGTFSPTSTVAHAAHLGGAAWGFAWWYFRVRQPGQRR